MKKIAKFIAYKLYEYVLFGFYFWFFTYVPYAAFEESGMKEIGFFAGCVGFLFSWLFMLYAVVKDEYK